MQKLVIPLKEKEMKEVSYHAHGSSFKKKVEEEEEGEDDKGNNINDGHVSLPTLAHDQSIWLALLL